ncbi:LysR family transcriptional regulator [Cytobacillus purgationiresistens]|uniref:LysR family transcriptional repressor of citA n=1 Tax=Cytobacillus purgationiresistens TaxID=863449 RepID=A0ABU0ANG4_9BACI|nr:LysR family transcriptional regulator [Cytobacillus purgationiresistens]MDQ0272833.1 LysR family transcriptional repressor of citA [Cytobacillus purgationiresistens]
MEFSWLYTFLTAAKCGNFRRTAELLYISQPSVTVHIHNLEKELGVELFGRKGRRVQLTEEGRRYIPHAEQLLEIYQKGKEDLQSFSQGYTASLSLAISPLIADTVLPFVLKRYMTEHPNVEVSVKVLESTEIEKAVLNEEIDLGLSSLSTTDPDLQCEVLFTDEVKLIAPHDGADAESAPPLDEEEIITKNHLLTDNHPVYWDTLAREIKYKFPNVKMMKVSQIHITKRFIIEGLGVSFLPVSTVRRELLEGWLLEVPCTTITLPQANTYAIIKHNHSKQKEFMKFLLNYRI